MALSDIFEEVPKRSSQEQVDIPADELQDYLANIRHAYREAGLSLNFTDKNIVRPGTHEDDLIFQVGLADYNSHIKAGFVARQGISLIQGMVTAEHGLFRDSKGFVVKKSGERARFHLTPGEEGSIMWLSDIIMRSAFEPGRPFPMDLSNPTQYGSRRRLG